MDAREKIENFYKNANRDHRHLGQLLQQTTPLTAQDLADLLASDEEFARKQLFPHAYKIKSEHVGSVVYYRGLIEFSNSCNKNCLYCGIRASNQTVHRYDIPDDEILAAARFAWENQYASIVMQSGERSDAAFIERVERLLRRIDQETRGELRVTLSCGEQSRQTYRRWYEAGARRYLLRIETSNPQLYTQIHPNDRHHQFATRLQCLEDLRAEGYQTGTGVMIGLPFQTLADLASDLLFFQQHDIHMVGMGPYVEHESTPLFAHHEQLLPPMERFFLGLKMVAVLRILMKDINIAAATALQAIDPAGREKALSAGANIIMPNVTPTQYREDYLLYENKPCTDEEPSQCKSCLEMRIRLAGDQIGYGEWGDSRHFKKNSKPTKD